MIGISYTSRGLRPHNYSPCKLSRDVQILHRTGRCARHFLAYETGCYADRSERCTAYAVPSAQVSCVQAFSSSFANLQLDFFFFFLRIKVYLMLTILRCYWVSSELYTSEYNRHTWCTAVESDTTVSILYRIQVIPPYTRYFIPHLRTRHIYTYYKTSLRRGGT